MIVPLHIARNYIDHNAADVDRALGFVGTIQTVMGGIGAPTFDVAHTDKHLAIARSLGIWVNIWAYASAALYGTQKIKVTDAKLRTDAAAMALSLRKHIEAGGKGGGLSILSECSDKWGCTAADYIQAFEDVAGIVREQTGDAFVPGWGLSSMMQLTNAASFRPPSAEWFDLHAYATTSVDFSVDAANNLVPKHANASRLMTWCDMATGMGLPIGVGECGVTDIPSIATSGKQVWLDYYGRLIGGSPAGVDLATRYKFALVALMSQDWTPYPNWLDGRWAPGLTLDEATAIYGANPPAALWGYPGCPEAVAVMKKKLAQGGQVFKAVTNPFVVA